MARGRTYRTTALVIDKTKLGETDLIVTFVAEDGRQLRAVGKGARKPGSRLAARCDLGCVVDLLAAVGRNLDVISEATLVEAPLGTMPTYPVVSAASAIAEVARLNCYQNATDAYVFPITRRALEALGGRLGELDGAHLDLIVAAYVFKLLGHMGYLPDLGGCVACGDPDVTFFSARAGGLLCASCASSIAGAEELDGRLADWLRSLIYARFPDLVQSAIDPATAGRLVAFAHEWAAVHLDARLKALEFLRGV